MDDDDSKALYKKMYDDVHFQRAKDLDVQKARLYREQRCTFDDVRVKIYSSFVRFDLPPPTMEKVRRPTAAAASGTIKMQKWTSSIR